MYDAQRVRKASLEVFGLEQQAEPHESARRPAHSVVAKGCRVSTEGPRVAEFEAKKNFGHLQPIFLHGGNAAPRSCLEPGCSTMFTDHAPTTPASPLNNPT